MSLEKNILRLICILSFTITGISCSGPDEKLEKPTSIILSVDKNNFKSDGNESVTFSVKANEKDITNSARIIYKEENTPLSGNNFSTNIPGTYTFYATFENLSSSDVKVNAMPIILILSADTTYIKANGKSAVTFSATADGSNVTGDVEIFFEYGESETLLEDNKFTTDQEGSYNFYCKYKDNVSNHITISVAPFTLTLKATTSSIKANGTETVAFTVMADDDDITNEAKIYRKEGEDVILIEGNTFETTHEGNYEFFAQHQKQTSNPVYIEAIISRLSLTSNKLAAKTSESIAFSAISDDINDVSSDMTLHITFNDKEETLNGNVFTPVSFGTYSVFASFEGRVSNTIKLEISPANVTLSADKNALKSTGADFATFTVYADGKIINGADIYFKREAGDILINDNKFSSNIQGTFSFYAHFAETKSELTDITVHFVNFKKQSCAMEVVATWCGYSPQMINAFHQVHKLYSDYIHIVSIHRSSSYLGSSDMKAEEFMNLYETSGTPFGIVDFEEEISHRSAEGIASAQRHSAHMHPATSGIAITSQKTDNSINVTLKVKANEANEYNVCAIIVEDNIVKQQLIYLNNSKDNTVLDNNYVHHSVATYIMPNTNLYTGKPLGMLQEGSEVTETFSIPLDKVVTEDRIINHSNCRVVAYVLKKENGKFYINNSATCPINGSVGFRYEE